MPMFMVEGQMGRMVLHAKSATSARSFAQRKYGIVNGPYWAKLATHDDLKKHITDGACFFNADGSIMDPFEAYPLAGLPVPARFARAS